MLNVIVPRSTQDAVEQCSKDPKLDFKAAGTDIMDRVHGGYLAPAGVVQLQALPLLRGITQDGRSFVLGALSTLDDVVAHAALSKAFPLMRDATDHTATPQVRNLATVGGSLGQRPRCWYLRNPEFHCRKKGGPICYAIIGDNEAHAIYDNPMCAAVHPSTMGAVLLALDGTLDVRLPGSDAVKSMTTAEFFTFDMMDPTRENGLPHGALIESVRVTRGTLPTRQAYERASPRLLADWAAVEVCLNLTMEGEVVSDARVVLGAVGRVPRRATAVEKALVGKPLTAITARAAAQFASEGATPLAHNQYKLQMANNTVEAALLKVLS